MSKLYFCHYDSPIDRLLLAGERDNLLLVSFSTGKMQHQPLPGWRHELQIFATVIEQLGEYFKGIRTEFSFKYTLLGTPFQQQVLRHVATIPYGQTTSYSDIAQQINNPKAIRAVGMANAKNNLPIIVPCHRVIGKNGALTGFSGGMRIKKCLLELESAT